MDSECNVIMWNSIGKLDMEEQLTLETRLLKQHGPVMGGADLMLALGFKTMPALRRAIREQRVGVRVFVMPGHRGKFALTTDVATLIENCTRR